MFNRLAVLLFGGFALSPAVYAEGNVPAVEEVVRSVDLVWMMMGAFLVFFMHAGFAMLETGFSRSKNALNILTKNILTMSIGSVLYFFIGYAIMFGESFHGVIGTSGFLLHGHADQIGFAIFQAVFAATCATIISGAVAERMKLSSYIVLTILMAGLIYPIVGHWAWGGGWLADLGFTDFAGSSVVHLTGAVGAVVTVSFLGPRIGKYTQGKINVIPGHNLPLGALGVFILWFGWFGFNGGSTLVADPEKVPGVIAATLLSGSMGVLSSCFYTRFKFKRIDPSLTMNGALAGLVGITAGCANVTPGGAMIIGLISGILLVEAVPFFDRVAKLDDPVGAIAVHGVSGVWGTIAVGLFSTDGGLFYGGGLHLLGIQTLGVVSVIIWTVAATAGCLWVMTQISSIRVSREEEISGLDFSEHGSSAYETTKSIFNENFVDPSGEAFGMGLIQRLDRLAPTTSKTKAELG